MLTGESPFLGDNKQETFLNISQVNIDYSQDTFEGISSLAIDFIKSLLVKNPRWGFLQLSWRYSDVLIMAKTETFPSALHWADLHTEDMSQVHRHGSASAYI